MFLQLGFQWRLRFVLMHSIVLFLQELVTALKFSDEDSVGWLHRTRGPNW